MVGASADAPPTLAIRPAPQSCLQGCRQSRFCVFLALDPYPPRTLRLIEEIGESQPQQIEVVEGCGRYRLVGTMISMGMAKSAAMVSNAPRVERS